ncbi:rhodanese-related sulfurtransferase [Bacillus sp. V3-13]|uniref:immunity 53 family protein n=1 Tax=Bacillus sp. V3-13 TaxID=2053728 RepID=UPI000C75A1CD|nr:immunity 53 family protein [Bacillus sp. V3-13]PLR77522.1 rhodanese-related sulfurtransferase [Bacillus sp. V3-13]
MDILNWLEHWFHNNCNGDWEHCHGIRIGTLDNPGWCVEISLFETYLEDSPFRNVKIERSNDDWIHCTAEDNVFKGYGGVKNLEEILNIFRKWASG